MGFSESYDWASVLRIIHEIRPNWKNTETYPPGKCLWEVQDKPRAEELLRRLFGQPGFVGLKAGIEANLRHLD
jgi:hypothetical protein